MNLKCCPICGRIINPQKDIIENKIVCDCGLIFSPEVQDEKELEEKWNKRTIIEQIKEEIREDIDFSEKMFDIFDDKSYEVSKVRDFDILHMIERIDGRTDYLLIHPGETVRELFHDHNVSPEDFEKATGIKSDYIKSVMNEKDDITEKFAEKLDDYFQIEKSFWMNLQKKYDHEKMYY